MLLPLKYIYYLVKSFIKPVRCHNFHMSEEIQLPKNTESAKTKETIPQLFGKNVRKYRTLKKLTQEQLSEKLSISQKHLSIIETGAQFASASLIQRIS